MTYGFTHEDIFPPSPSSGWDLGHWAENKALRAGVLGLGAWDLGLKDGFCSWALGLGLEAGI